MITERSNLEVVYVKGDIYVFGGLNNSFGRIKSVDKYSLISKTWSQVTKMNDDREFFWACAFIDKILVNRGIKDGVKNSSCLQFDTNDYSWKKVSKMNEARSSAACAVFEEKIVVTGGLNTNPGVLKSVESYDVLPNKWSKMPNMNSRKYDHSLMVVKNKLFVISKREDNCEVCDKFCQIFITIKSPQLDWFSRITAYSI